MLDWLKRKPTTSLKESRVGIAISQFVAGNPVFTPRNYEGFSKEGYIRNVIAFRCVNIISRAASSVQWGLFQGTKELNDHPALKLLRKPNASEGQADFFERLVAYLQIAGNSYIEATQLTPDTLKPPLELWIQRPDRMQVIAGDKGLPKGYRYTANGVNVDFQCDPITGRSNIYHFKTIHPMDDWYGLSPMEAAAFAIDQHNAAGEHNAALLQNRAVPSGAMIFKGNVKKSEMDRVQRALLDRYAGPRNAGKPMVLTGEADWKEMGLSPRDLDFNKGTLQVARDVCNGFGVPHVLVVPGESTYRNMEEARLMLWEETIIPLLDRVKSGPLAWLALFYGKDLQFQYDLDKVSALIPRRQMHHDTVNTDWTSGLITRDEAREALGYDKVKVKGSGDQFFGAQLGEVDPNADSSKKNILIP